MVAHFAALIDAFRQVPSSPERLPTLMEISGYPHYESVCSNILAFFLDPSKPHGLGTLFLDALARVGGIVGQGSAIGGDVQIDREARTDAGNFVDILIQSDSHAILIENKIFAGVANPFADYDKHLHGLPQRHKYRILLTLRPDCGGADHGFRNITHEQFINEIRGILGGYVGGADTRYMTYFLDFLNTIDHLLEGTVMNPGLAGFLATNQDQVEAFLREIEKFRGELRNKVQGLKDLIQVNAFPHVSQWLYRSREYPLHDVLVHDITLDRDFVVAIDTVVEPDGWEIQIFPRRRRNDPNTQQRLKELLQVQGVSVCPGMNEDGRYIHQNRFEYTAGSGEIAQVVQTVVDQIANFDGLTP